ncbi:MAG: zf-HC2 domain-containing protein [Acidobacteria bacterium]|jgi:hypothetical protein|nr:zf-HC2 domain-containing protein [Acidobacteriota bacterium]
MNEHIAGEVLAAYVDGTLPSGSRRRAEAHLSRCSECREALAEVFTIGNSLAPVPPEFLERALPAVPPRFDAMPAGGNVAPVGVPARRALPLRLVFGVAAVLLVALAVHYLFIGRERAGVPGIAEKRMPETVVALEQSLPPAPAETTVADRAVAEAAHPQAPPQALRGQDAEKKRASGEAASGIAPAASSFKSKAPADSAQRQERLRAADETDMMPLREQEGGVIGGVLGGAEALPEKDRFAGDTLSAPAPGRDKGSRQRKAETLLPRLVGSVAAGDAMQLFLAATGRAVAPRLLPAEAWSQAPAVRIAGNVTEDDLIALRPLAAWDWLPAGMALEVTIAGDGSVRAITLLGEWDLEAADRARTAAAQLLFSGSTLETRRAVLFRDPLN